MVAMAVMAGDLALQVMAGTVELVVSVKVPRIFRLGLQLGAMAVRVVTAEPQRVSGVVPVALVGQVETRMRRA